MTVPLLARRDIDFFLFDWLKAHDLPCRNRYVEHSHENFSAFLDLCEDVAARYFAPHNKKGDAEEPQFDGESVTVIPEVKQALDAFVGADLLGITMDYEVGGSQLPRTVADAGLAWFAAANVSTYAYLMLTAANANLLMAHGSAEQIESFVKPMLKGEHLGTMCLSETEAGSSLADITTRAEPAQGGCYRLFGSKMWISGGDHELSNNIVHLVLAKISGGPAGAKGISLFVVPKFVVAADGTYQRNDVTLVGLNHKMGYRGTTNTVLAFGDGAHNPGGAAGAIGYLVGEPHYGLKYMFHMMNEARLAVGMGAVALGYTGYLKSVAYAKERRQGRAAKSAGVSAAPVAIIEHADVKRMLLAQKSYVEGAMALALFCSRLVDIAQSPLSPDEGVSAELMLDVLTPVAKSWPSQWCLEANHLAIQVHGGYGYSREYDVEQHYRDNRLNAIHEGTYGIQSLDLLGRKVGQLDGAGLAVLDSAVRNTIAEAAAHGGEVGVHATALTAAWTDLLSVTEVLLVHDDLEVSLANSAIYMEAFGHIVVAWIWLQLLCVVGARDGEFFDGKRQAGSFFFRYELPKTGAQLALLRSKDRTTVDMRPTWF
ncbi:acyl-CoA dehydrogenase [Mycobacterium deserti]|uniref:Acyl-CoA dehydrogenase n=1 Tax=Mycobacterium deserti TaxID=2978347 RepID=A0ABT2MEQ6_9MYCO|nr:acyl-CoA dehydrogenase [Mycobacterium deserti]MCT7660727.1 acyl-CoA dehydrogenase [Mycobacterium deserti]